MTTSTRRSQTPLTDASTPTTNERILDECHKMYTDPDRGLIKIAEEFGLKLLPPRKKIIILLIGNHSAGKSSFINWYIEENVQRTGVAIETQGFTIITSGKKRETLMGEATLFLYPHFKALEAIPGVVDFLSTEISTSKERKFNLITFVDTPGLVDGGMQYPFDVNKAIYWLGDMADLVFVFFDPIGQALCKRTIDIVEKLNGSHSEKLRFYLSKADEAGAEPDRQKVMMQIVQELCKRPGLNRQGFDMPTIYIPNLGRQSSCANQMDEVCLEIERTINSTVQITLNTVTKDCQTIEQLLTSTLENDINDWKVNFRKLFRGLLYALFTVASVLSIFVLVMTRASPESKTSITSKFFFNTNPTVLDRLFKIVKDFDETTSFRLIVFSFFVAIYCSYVTFKSFSMKSTISITSRFKYEEYRKHIENSVKPKKERLYIEYLEQSVGSYDLSR